MTKEEWFRYTIFEQMSNIGAEVGRFIDARKRFQNGESSEDYSEFYYNKAISFLNIIEQDPKNQRRINELEDCKKELEYLKVGVYSDEYIRRYYEQYTAACAFRKQERGNKTSSVPVPSSGVL